MTTSVITARLQLYRRLRENCRRRAESPWLEIFHYLLQLRRGYSQKRDQGYSVSKAINEIDLLGHRLGSDDPTSAWASVDRLLQDFPWQQQGFAEFTMLAEWRRRYDPTQFPERTRLVEVDPFHPGALRPYQADGRRLWLVMGGNRTHISSEEWQDPQNFGEPLIKHAESAMWKFLSTMTRVLRPLLGDEFAIVGIAPSAIESRWEARLENFAVTRFPDWVHPRNMLLACDIQKQFGLNMLKAADGNVVAAYSLGCAAAEQTMNAASQLEPKVKPEQWARSAYFAGYVGLRNDLKARQRVQIISVMDECVAGSADLPDTLEEAVQDRWFSSPLTLRPNPWSMISEDFEKQLATTDSGNGWVNVINISSATQLVILASQCSIPADNDGNAILDQDRRMALTRFGHYLDATLEEFFRTETAVSVMNNVVQLQKGMPETGLNSPFPVPS